VPRRKKRSRTGSIGWQSPRLTGLLQVALGAWLLLSLFGATPSWWSVIQNPGAVDLFGSDNPGGPVGSLAAFALRVIFGQAWAWPIAGWLFLRGIMLGIRRTAPLLPWPGKSLPLAAASAAWLAQPTSWFETTTSADLGGAPAFYLAQGFHALFGQAGGLIFLSFFLLTAVVLVLRPWLGPVLHGAGVALDGIGSLLLSLGRGLFWLLQQPWRLLRGIVRVWTGFGRDLKKNPETMGKAKSESNSRSRSEKQAYDDAPGETPAQRRVHRKQSEEVEAAAAGSCGVEGLEDTADLKTMVRQTRNGGSVSTLVKGKGVVAEQYPELDGDSMRDPDVVIPLPSMSLLHDPPAQQVVVTVEDLNASADLLEATLRSFGVDGTVKDVRPGPVVTTFEYQPASGVKINAIVQRTDDLALSMKARSIRMEAPIPGKAAVGIEIPNPIQEVVSIKEVMTLAQDMMDKPLSVVLGRDVFGEAVCIDLAAQPHLLVAGSTGSGKSVCINAIVTSLLLRCDPSIVRMMLIDPKMLELNVYNDIPHLLTPVITDPKEALRGLKWMEAQMDHRYRRLAKHSVRNIEGYNAKVAAGLITDRDGDVVREPMPYYVCIVDELADLMIQLGQEIELPITRIAQKARAVGIHLILATQRPSVDVLTGVIKANVPCRIAFRVIQKNDSRTILDTNGAEKLLGCGDMLYLMPGRAQPKRVHGAFVDIAECEAVAAHWREYKEITREITLVDERSSANGLHLEDDPLFERAREFIVMAQHGSTSMLQRKLQVGYARAGRLMDLLEQAGVVGPFIGSKAREVLMKPQDLEALEAVEGGDDY